MKKLLEPKNSAKTKKIFIGTGLIIVVAFISFSFFNAQQEKEALKNYIKGCKKRVTMSLYTYL